MNNIHRSIKDSAIPLFCNTPQNRLGITVDVVSDTIRCPVSLYEHDGVYWYCLEYVTDINSVGFTGLRNCVSSMRRSVADLGFVISNNDSLLSYVRGWEKSCRRGRRIA